MAPIPFDRPAWTEVVAVLLACVVILALLAKADNSGRRAHQARAAAQAQAAASGFEPAAAERLPGIEPPAFERLPGIEPVAVTAAAPGGERRHMPLPMLMLLAGAGLVLAGGGALVLRR